MWHGSPRSPYGTEGHDCRHSGYYSGLGVYLQELQSLRYVLICDDCGAEMKEVSRLEYTPNPMLDKLF
jgi:hypothetical protein